MNPLDADPFPSPCISMCKMDARLGTTEDRAAGGLCIGCLRTIDEIVEWGAASDDRKRDIMSIVQSRRDA